MELHRLDCLGSHGSLEYYDFLREQAEELKRKPEIKPPLLTGKDLIALGMKPGPEMGKLLDEIREKQLADELKNPRQAKAWVKREFQAQPPSHQATKNLNHLDPTLGALVAWWFRTVQLLVASSFWHVLEYQIGRKVWRHSSGFSFEQVDFRQGEQGESRRKPFYELAVPGAARLGWGRKARWSLPSAAAACIGPVSL